MLVVLRPETSFTTDPTTSQTRVVEANKAALYLKVNKDLD